VSVVGPSRELVLDAACGASAARKTSFYTMAGV
jgi:hypothetical protein